MVMNGTVKCLGPMKAASTGVFQGDDPLDYALPLAILQICIVLILSRFLAYLLKPLRQPRVIAEIVVSSYIFLNFYEFVMPRVPYEFDIQNLLNKYSRNSGS